MKFKNFLILIPSIVIGILIVFIFRTERTIEQSHIQIKLCLKDEKNLLEFKNTMRSIAHLEHMNFIDGSERTRRNLETIGATEISKPVIHMGLERKDGTGLTVSDLFSPVASYQVYVSFSAGPNSTEANRFADAVIRQLKEHWHVYPVPARQSNSPIKSCNE